MLLGLFVRVGLLVAAYAVCEYVSGHYSPLKPVTLASAKALPALYLFVSAVTQGKQIAMAYYPKLFGIGLLFCAFGDAALRLEMAFGNDQYFLAGIVFFLIGHVLFTLGFRAKRSNLVSHAQIVCKHVPTKEPGWGVFIAVALYAGAMMSVLVPRITNPVLKYGVCVYASVIACMFHISVTTYRLEIRLYSDLSLRNGREGDDTPEARTGVSSIKLTRAQRKLFLSVSHDNKVFTAGFPSYVVGTLLFMLSDSILGYSKFVEGTSRPFSVLSTYFASLVFICHGALTEGVVPIE